MGSAQSEAQAWLSEVTQTYGQNGEHGIDIGLGYGTPVYAPTGGVVEAAGYDPQIGGVVSWRDTLNYGGIAGDASLYVQHLASVVVQAGQAIAPGQLIGYSGGQLPWQVPGGGLHPNTTNVSTGPHIEFGINSPAQGSVDLWHAIGPNVNPQGLLQAVAGGSGGTVAASGPSSTGYPLAAQTAGSPLGLDLNPSDWVNAIKSSFTDVAQRAALIWFGMTVVVVGLLVLFFSSGEAQRTEEHAQQGAQAAAAVAA